MKYLVSDFYFLSSAVDLKAKTVGEAYESMSTFMGYPVSMPCLLHAIRGLVAGGYLTVAPEGGVITVALEAGQAFTVTNTSDQKQEITLKLANA